MGNGNTRNTHEEAGMARLILTRHAQQRAAQRGLSPGDVEYVVRYGAVTATRDAEIYYLRGIDIPRQDYAEKARLEGCAVITAKGYPAVITVWRNRKGGRRNIRRKVAQAAAA